MNDKEFGEAVQRVFDAALKAGKTEVQAHKAAETFRSNPVKKRQFRLRQAHAYWRLAATARKNSQWKTAEHFEKLADRRHREWQEAVDATRRTS